MGTVTFRKVTVNDVEFVNSLRSRVTEYLHNDEIFSTYDALRWFETNHPLFYVIVYDGEDVGYFRTSLYDEVNRSIYIGADLLPERWGQGIAQLAYKKFIPFLFESLGLNKISLEVLSTNERAVYLYDKLGFVKEGVKRQEVYRDGVYIDSILMSILSEELHA